MAARSFTSRPGPCTPESQTKRTTHPSAEPATGIVHRVVPATRVEAEVLVTERKEPGWEDDTPPATPPHAEAREVPSGAGHRHDSLQEFKLDRPVLARPQSLATLKGKKGKPTKGLTLPPELEATICFRHIYRFKSTSTSAGIVSAYSLGAVPGVAATSSSAGRTIITSIRINTIKVWSAANSTSSTPQTVSLSWSAAVFPSVKDSEKMRTLPDGVSVTGVLLFVPPAKSLMSDWFVPAQVDSGNLFYLQSPIGSVVDVDLSCTLANTMSTQGVNSASGTYTPGNIYYSSLDGSNNYQTEGLPPWLLA